MKIRSKINSSDKWDTSDLYNTDSQWEKDFKIFKKNISNYSNFKNKLNSVISIKKCIDFHMNHSRGLEKLFTYSHLKSDENKTHSHYQAMLQTITTMLVNSSKESSFIVPELMSLQNTFVKSLMSDSRLNHYNFYLEQIFRLKKHILSDKEESILAASSEIAHSSNEVFSMLDNADVIFEKTKDPNGNIIEITHGNFNNLLQNRNREFRQKIFKKYYKKYMNHKYTYSSLLSNSVKKDYFYSKIRGYKSTIEKVLHEDNIPIGVYDNLISTVNKNFEPLYKYFQIRKKILEINNLHIYDCFVPLVQDLDWDMNFNDASSIILKSLELLGTEYCDIVKKGLTIDGWVDKYENVGKRSGAYSSGCHDSKPYILMNYVSSDINSVYTLIHELGHSLHSYYSRKYKSYTYSDYTIFVAEVASTFNEACLTKYLMSQAKDDKMKIYLISREIDNIRGTLYRQTMFAEFEKQIHGKVVKDEPITLELIKNIYHSLLEKYFHNSLILDSELDYECLRIPHFYSSFYVYKYATGISCAYYLFDKISKGDKVALKNYINFLKSGGSKYSVDLLKNAGVDITVPTPIQNTLNKFSLLVDSLDELTK